MSSEGVRDRGGSGPIQAVARPAVLAAAPAGCGTHRQNVAQIARSSSQKNPAPFAPPICPREDSNLHVLTDTSTSSLRVCQFRHPGVQFTLV